MAQCHVVIWNLGTSRDSGRCRVYSSLKSNPFDICRYIYISYMYLLNFIERCCRLQLPRRFEYSSYLSNCSSCHVSRSLILCFSESMCKSSWVIVSLFENQWLKIIRVTPGPMANLGPCLNPGKPWKSWRFTGCFGNPPRQMETFTFNN